VGAEDHVAGVARAQAGEAADDPALGARDSGLHDRLNATGGPAQDHTLAGVVGELDLRGEEHVAGGIEARLAGERVHGYVAQWLLLDRNGPHAEGVGEEDAVLPALDNSQVGAEGDLLARDAGIVEGEERLARNAGVVTLGRDDVNARL